jgi:hypothetical protein
MSERRFDLDAVRGLMLVLMTLTHLPTRWSDPFGQPFGYVSAAEGFVMLSAYMAGMVYAGRGLKEGLPAMRRAFLLRALKIYGCQAALLLFLFSFIAAFGLTVKNPDVRYLISYYLREPLTAFWSALLLIHNPPLLDILPLYIVFMLASPWVLAWGLSRGWGGVLPSAPCCGCWRSSTSAPGPTSGCRTPPACRCRPGRPAPSRCGAGSSCGCSASTWVPVRRAATRRRASRAGWWASPWPTRSRPWCGATWRGRPPRPTTRC